MKRNLLLLAVMILVAFGFSSLSVAQCPEAPNDYGECDTLHLAVWETDNALPKADGPPWFVKVNIRVTHDIVDETRDSLAGFAIPLSYEVVESFGPVAYCSLSSYWNNDKVLPSGKVVRSVFRHMPDMDTPTEYNWMMKLSEEEDPEWDSRTVDLFGNTADSGHFWMALLPLGAPDRRFPEGERVLLATMTFKLDLDDTCDICIDTMFWPPTQRVSFSNADASTFIPRMDWKSSKQDEEFCFRVWIIPNDPPICDPPPQDASHSENGTYTSTQWTNFDPDGEVVMVTHYLTGSCGGIGNVVVNHSGVPAQTVTGTITYDVLDHCEPGCCEIFIVCTDDAGAKDTCGMHIDLTNNPPACTEPDDMTGPYNETMVSTDFTCTDPDGDPTTMTIVGVQPPPCGSGPFIVANHVEWAPCCCDVSIPYVVTLQCTDICEASAPPQTFTMHATNDPPFCDLDMPDILLVNSVTTVGFSYDDPQGAETVTDITATSECGDVSNLTFADGSGIFVFTASSEVGPGFVELTVTDECGLSSTCRDDFEKVSTRLNAVVIPNKVYERFGFGHWDYVGEIILDDACPPYYGINPGDFFEIPIILEGFGTASGTWIGGFELEVEFDYIDLTFYGAMRGCLLSERWYDPTVPPPIDSILYSWEYFSYRVLPCTDLHKYKILLFGQADMPDGEFRRGYCIGDGAYPDDVPSFWCVDQTQDQREIGASLVWLKFRVANNELLRDLKLPVFFEWEHKLSAEPPYYIIQDWDCAENTMSDPTGNNLYVSKDPMQYNLVVCGDDVVDTLEFVDGGVHICSPCTSFVCVRGDINHDGIAYTTADAVLFARYFVEGIIVFIDDMDEQICATDVNADGRTLMLADLVYLIRVILQVAPEIPKLGPSSEVVNVIVYDNIITTECASPIGAILFEFDGAVVPTLLADMEMVNKGNKVLVWSRDGETITTAEVLSFIGDAELVSVTAVDYDTRELQTSITVKVAPSAFALNPAYPNPFNPFTNLSFTLPEALNYTLKIYNVAGQLVRSYEGMGSAGLNVITWDAKDHAGLEVASGVYFYKLTAAGFSATKKMVMMK